MSTNCCYQEAGKVLQCRELMHKLVQSFVCHWCHLNCQKQKKTSNSLFSANVTGISHLDFVTTPNEKQEFGSNTKTIDSLFSNKLSLGDAFFK